MVYTYKNIFKTTVPLYLGLLSQNILNVIDTVFVAHIGELELGATVIASIFYMCISTVSLGYSIGVQVLIAKYNGEKDYKSINNIFHNSLYLSIICSGLIFIFTYFLGKNIVIYFITSPRVAELTNYYMEYRFYGIFFVFPSLVFRSLYIAVNRSGIILQNSVVMMIFNIFLNYILINGKFDFPALGLIGAAIASVVSELISLIHFYIYTYNNQKILVKNKVTKIDVGICRQILNISIGTMTQNFLNICTWLFFFISIEHLGERSLSISNIVRSISTILFISITAFSYTINSYVSNLVGSKQYQEIIPVAKNIFYSSLAVMIVFLIFIYIFPSTIISIYTSNSELISETTPSLLIYSSCCIIAVPSSILLNIIIGLGCTKISLFIQFITSIFYLLYIYIFIVYLKVDVSLSWLCEHIYWMCILVCSFIYLCIYTKKNLRISLF